MVFFHEDDYCQQEILPAAAVNFCRQQMTAIDAFAQEHQTSHGYTDIYLRKDSPQTISQLQLTSEQLWAALNFLPPFEQVETGYGTYRKTSTAIKGAGLSRGMAVFWSLNAQNVLDALWLILEVAPENIPNARQILVALGRLAPLVLADWPQSVLVDLADAAAIDAYLAEKAAD